MTDLERAEELANNGYALGCTKSPFEAAKEGFLAGLKSTRQEKWHDLRKDPNDLPEAHTSVINQNGVNVIYDDTKKVWRYDNADECICDDPIAWREIPTFEE